ncbi:MAG: replication protein [Circoviridae sp.]|nr:MAG: replication protein [Circoviridae sp.]
MEDTIVCKGLYAYQFRVDISGNPQSTAEIRKFLEIYKFKKYVGQYEISGKNKPHYQMCLWRETPFTPSEQTKARNYWRGKTSKTKQPVSLTNAKKIKSLAAYCQKVEKQLKMTDFFQHFNNLSKEEKMQIPKWESKTAVKQNKRDIYKSTLKNVVDTKGNMDKMDFLQEINKAYYYAYGRPCLHKSVYCTALYEYNYIDDMGIVSFVFPFSLP